MKFTWMNVLDHIEYNIHDDMLLRAEEKLLSYLYEVYGYIIDRNDVIWDNALDYGYIYDYVQLKMENK